MNRFYVIFRTSHPVSAILHNLVDVYLVIATLANSSVCYNNSLPPIGNYDRVAECPLGIAKLIKKL